LESIGERLKWLRLDKDLNQDEVEEGSTVPRSTLSRAENNQGRSYADTILSLADYYNASLEWILRGKGHPYLDVVTEFPPDLMKLIETYHQLDERNRYVLLANATFLNDYKNNLNYISSDADHVHKDHPPCPEVIKEEKRVYLPVLGTVAAGMPIMADEFLEGFLPVPAKKIKKNTYIVRAQGESMIDAGIQNGDLIMIIPQPSVEQGEMALVKVDGNVTIKKFYLYDHEIRLRPANETMEDIVITDLAKVTVLGKVIGVIAAEEANITMRHEFNGEEDQ